jgi:hypothetical protein
LNSQPSLARLRHLSHRQRADDLGLHVPPSSEADVNNMFKDYAKLRQVMENKLPISNNHGPLPINVALIANVAANLNTNTNPKLPSDMRGNILDFGSDPDSTS